MKKLTKSVFYLLMGGLLFQGCAKNETSNKAPIDREALVSRHAVHINEFDTLNSLSVGNGQFAFTVDPTGLQSFPELYSKGMPLGTQSEWGWHAWPNTEDFKREETYRYYDVDGRKIPYSMQLKDSQRSKDVMNYFRKNPHRLHLGVVGLEFMTSAGKVVTPDMISQVAQTLNMWTGEISSKYVVDGKRVEVSTICHPVKDMVSVQIKSMLIKSGQLKVKLRYPYPTGGHVDDACNWTSPEKHTTSISSTQGNGASIVHDLSSYVYHTNLAWETPAKIEKVKAHEFVVMPEGGDTFEFSCEFSEESKKTNLPPYAATKSVAASTWQGFWSTGGAVDFTGSTDERAKELERRIVLSQYLTRIQCAGNYCPQETGLTCNSWYGKFHLEMHWWHSTHWALWNRVDLLEKSLGWYNTIISKAKAKAELQGYEGVRWPKMTDMDGGDSPSSVGEFLIWQQPHIIYFSELCYRHYKNDKTLNKYKDLVFATADFMASFPVWEEANNRYILGPPLIPAQESLPREKNVNPPYELVYWRMGLRLAQEWRVRLGMEPSEKYQKVLDHLSQLAVKNNLYLGAESAPDTYENERYFSDHPIVLGAYGMLPGEGAVDPKIMGNTFDHIFKTWNWPETWGWDYPLTAMSATRLGKPEKAVDALMMDVLKNTYLKNGHNYQGTRLRLYLPGNGGLLSAIAMMCAGYDGSTQELPGFPKEGWKVKWENLSKMP